MLDLGNFGGTLCYYDTPICEFKFINDNFDVSKVKVLNQNMNLRPWMIRDYYYGLDWHLFFEEQVTPETRIGLLEDLRDLTPIRAYIPEQILRITNGKNFANMFKVICDDDLSCWEQWQIMWLKEHGKL